MAFPCNHPRTAAAVVVALALYESLAFAVRSAQQVQHKQKSDVLPQDFSLSKKKLDGLGWYSDRSVNDKGMVQYLAVHTRGDGKPSHVLVSSPPNLVTLSANGDGNYVFDNIGDSTVLTFTPDGKRKPLLKFSQQTRRPSIFEPDHHGILELPGGVQFTYGKSIGGNKYRTDHWFMNLGNENWTGVVYLDEFSKIEAFKNLSPLWSKKVDSYIKYAKKKRELGRDVSAGVLLMPIYERYRNIFELLYALQGDRFGNDAKVPVDLSTIVHALEVPGS